ncbi:MAG TPA: metallophosphoesterase [Chthoniobacterales bacterium]|nr:metallophosphoesterase [Chthoniobacterales bacterium]
MPNLSRRRFLKITALSVPAIAGVHASIIEPARLQVRHFKASPQGGCRFVHFSDLHYRGDANYAGEIVRTINDLKPEFVCFTGDLIEQSKFVPEALSFIRQIGAPVYGAPGNHDYWSRASFTDFYQAFRQTGGEWLVDRSLVLAQHNLEIHGMGWAGIHAFKPPQAERRLLLAHYPAMSDTLGRKFDLILSGHSHGGQIRLPFYGPLLIPKGVGRYDLGHFMSRFGPLYVSAGVGTLSTVPLRWNCPPEVTVVTI